MSKLVKESIEDVFKAPKMSDLIIKGKPASEQTLIETWEDNINDGYYVMYIDKENDTVLITEDGMEILEADIGGAGVTNIDMLKKDVVDLLLAMFSFHGDTQN